MKAWLDHVGIAVSELERSLAFFRDVLGLHVEPAEEVASQKVRAHFLHMGSSSLELLEATSPESAIAKFVERRGPGLHHVALRVEDIDAALAELSERGVRLIDTVARPGAEGARVAFIHPSAAHGVLVELKEPAPKMARFRTPVRHSLGDFELVSLSDGFFRLDGGAMFGVVPRTLWETRLPPDDRHRIPLGLRPLVVRGGGLTVLIDAGCGDKMDAKSAAIYGLDRRYHLDHSLADAGLAPDDIDVVIASHLHFDHIGGFTMRRADGTLAPRFPRARYVAHAGEWHDATHPHERNRASYLAENYVPLLEAGRVEFIEEDGEVLPGISVWRTGGHTMHHQIVRFESGGRTAIFAADLIPTVAHVDLPWIMGYDLYPMDTLAYKRRFLADAIAGEYVIFFEHDPVVTAGIIRDDAGRPWVEPVSS